MQGWVKKLRPGFTIVELLIVIVVIGVLAAIIIVGYGMVQNNARDTSLKADLTKFGEMVHLKVLDDQVVPQGGGTSSLTGDPTNVPGVIVDPEDTSYDGDVANLYYCEGTIDGIDEFGFIARSLSGKVFKYLSKGGLSEITTPTTWTAATDPTICTTAGFTAPFTWGYGYNPDVEILWNLWAEPND